MPDGQGLSQQDIQDLQDIASKLPKNDPRAGKIKLLLASQPPTTAPVAPIPDPAGPMYQKQNQAYGGPMITSKAQDEFLAKALPQVNQRVADIRKSALQIGGGSFGAEAGALAKGLPKALQMLATASGAGAGVGAGTIAGGGSPQEALGNAAGTTATGMILNPLAEWIGSSKTLGAKMLQQASAKAGNAPIELSPRTNELLDDIIQEDRSGGHAPKVITDILKRVGPNPSLPADAAPGPLTYDEARRFQGNLSSLSVAERQNLQGKMGGLMKQLAASWSKDVQNGANAAGAGPEHALGMSEYAAASSRGRTVSKILKAAGVGGGIGAGAYELLKLIKP